jgi:hypothetical protein
MTPPPSRGRLLALATGLVACGVLAANTTVYWRSLRVSDVPSSRRYWEDMGVATHLYLDAVDPEGRLPGLPSEQLAEAAKACQTIVRKIVKRDRIEPWQFWRSIGPRLFEEIRDKLTPGRAFEDQGRSRILAMAFRVLGGISPFFLLWMGALAAAPLLVWLAWELWGCSHGLAGSLFLALFVLSPFVAGVLSLPHGGVGFCLVGFLALLAVAAHGILGRPSLASLALRALAAGGVFALAALCRGSVLLLAGGFVAAFVLAGRRLGRPVVVTLVGSALTFGPYVLVRPPEHHNVWPSIWEGLGDFDREKGYVWSDRAAKAALAQAGVDSGSAESYGFAGEACDAFFRGKVLGDIRADPLWYATILAQRLRATLTQDAAGRYGAEDLSSLPDPTPSEGNIERYYRLATPVTYLGFGPFRVRVGVAAFALPSLIFLGLWLWGRLDSRPLLRSTEGPGWMVLVAAVALLPSPLLVTTASALETEMFVLVYSLASAFLLEGLIAFAWRPRKEASPADHPGDAVGPKAGESASVVPG